MPWALLLAAFGTLTLVSVNSTKFKLCWDCIFHMESLLESKCFSLLYLSTFRSINGQSNLIHGDLTLHYLFTKCFKKICTLPIQLQLVHTKLKVHFRRYICFVSNVFSGCAFEICPPFCDQPLVRS